MFSAARDEAAQSGSSRRSRPRRSGVCSQCFSFYQPSFANLIGSTRMPQIDSRDAGSAILADDFLCSNPDGSLIDRKVWL